MIDFPEDEGNDIKYINAKTQVAEELASISSIC